MRAIVERQLRAEGDLYGVIYELMVGHHYTVFEIRDVVDVLSGPLHEAAHSRRSATQSRPDSEMLADFAFRGAPESMVFCA